MYRPSRPWFLAPLILAAKAAVIAGFLLAVSQASAASAAPPASAVPPVPPAQLIKAAELRALLDRQRGRVVVLNLWATWCVPCLREIPDLVELEKEFAARGVTLMGLGMDEGSSLQGMVEPFRRKHFPEFRTWLRNEPDMDTLVSVVDPAWNEVLPTTYLIGRDGKLARKIQGKKTLAEFRKLLGEVL